jgi:hypothetical protein
MYLFATKRLKHLISYIQKKKTGRGWSQDKLFLAVVFEKNKKGTFNDRQKIAGASLQKQIKLIEPYKIEKPKTISFQVSYRWENLKGTGTSF